MSTEDTKPLSPAFAHEAKNEKPEEPVPQGDGERANNSEWTSDLYRRHQGYTGWGTRHARRGSMGWNSSG